MPVITTPFSLINVVSWVIFGLLIGLVANFLFPLPMKGEKISTVILGILGAVFGGLLASVLFGIGAFGFDLSSLIIAVLGALILLFIQRIFFQDNEYIKTRIKRMG